MGRKAFKEIEQSDMTEKEYEQNFAILDKQFEFHFMQFRLESALELAKKNNQHELAKKLKDKIQQNELIWRMQ